jgi:Protein of unknown function (DUF3089)
MKKIFFISLAVVVSVVHLYAQKGQALQQNLEKILDRDAAPNSGPAPDYSNLYFWASSPYKHDPGDSIPAFLKDEKRDSCVDVFFIHPTSYLGNAIGTKIIEPDNNLKEILDDLKTASWNADLTDSAINKRTDFGSILYQASVFNGSCRVFAPRYRQANIKAFFVRDTPSAQNAFDLAYSDIKKAFEYYLKHDNNGRPVIIASHSQGSLHAIRLLREFFDGKPLQQKLVCAYIIGYQIPVGTFKQIPIGNSPEATGCFVGWRSYQKGEIPGPIKREEGNSVCVNPLTWKTSTEWAPVSLNKGSLSLFNTLAPHAVSAGIEPASKILWVSLPEDLGEKIKKLQNLHIYDYNLFWMNIRVNIKQRTDAWLKKNNNP